MLDASEPESSNSSAETEAKLSVAKAILSIASGVMHHSVFSDGHKTLIEKMVSLSKYLNIYIHLLY